MIEYYLNRNKSDCPNIPSREERFLNKENLLSEFKSEEEKSAARENLGISKILEQLSIAKGALQFDETPTPGHTTHVVSSDALSKLITSKEQLQEAWTEVIQSFQRQIECIESDLNDILEQVNHIPDLETSFLLQKQDIEKFKEEVNEKLSSQFERRLKTLEIKINSFLNSNSEGTALTDTFGNSETLGINQETITRAINEIWDKINSLTGEQDSEGIIMTATPNYWVKTNTNPKGTINITAETSVPGRLFDTIIFYINDVEIANYSNVGEVTLDPVQVNEDVVVKCVATIRGNTYTKEKKIFCYQPFWLFASENPSEIQNFNGLEHLAMTDDAVGSYNVEVETDNQYICIITGNSESFIRADLNSIEIPFNQSTITIGNIEYTLYTSVNLYKAGTYNIDINK